MLNVQRLPLGEMLANCYLISSHAEVLIIDPADESDFISGLILKSSLQPKALIATHGHLDHILASEELKLSLKIPFYANKKDFFLISKMPKQAQKYLKTTALPVKIDQDLKDKDKIKLGDEILEVIEIPGHTPGSICLYSKSSKAAFVGDLVFKDGSVGRYDFGYSDKVELKKSVSKILKLPGDTIIYPGHGEAFLLKDTKFDIQFI